MSADKVVIAILFVKIFKLAMTVLFNFFYINLFPMSLIVDNYKVKKVNFQNFSNINVKLLF